MKRIHWLASVLDDVHSDGDESFNFYFKGFPGCRDAGYRVFVTNESGKFEAFKWRTGDKSRWLPCCNKFCETMRTLAIGRVDI